MTSFKERPHIDPLLRTMGMPPSLVRYASESATKQLHTVLLRESVLAKTVDTVFDESCLLTVVEGDEERLGNVKLALPGGKRQYTGLHLTVLTGAGQLSLLLGGDHQSVFIGAGCAIRASFHMSLRPKVFVGDGTTIGPSKFIVSNADLVIGSDCEIQDDVLIECSHQHQMHDLAAGQPLHEHRSAVALGRHVWIGRRAMVLPGVKIGDGAVVEAGAVVSHNVAANTLVGGAPARSLREQVSWSRQYGKSPPVLPSSPVIEP